MITDLSPATVDAVHSALESAGVPAEDAAVVLIRTALAQLGYRKCFAHWESLGIHVTPVDEYSPIPDVHRLDSSLWASRRDDPGLDMNDALQLRLLTHIFPQFQHEYADFPLHATSDPAAFYFHNGMFGGTDALVLYCMIRHFRPRTVVEVGAGFSTRVSGRAALVNGETSVVAIEPHPDDALRDGIPGLERLVEAEVQDVDVNLFTDLDERDILFIDSSHVVRIGSDVNHLVLNILPVLKPGVIVHVHDVYLPFEFREDWVREELRFWNEQYLLQAFLSFNNAFEVVFANAYIARKYPEDMKRVFPTSPWWGGGSFWIRRRHEGHEQ
jgi:hypothetical protein